MTADTPERQFDFWLGHWDVEWDGGRGTNRIDALFGGAVIRERFDGRPGVEFLGTSLSVYDQAMGKWRQTWVDSERHYWAFTGEFAGEEMHLRTEETRDGSTYLLRMVFFDIEADSLNWRWERSDDGGRTWELKWLLRYTRRDSRQNGGD